MLISYRVLVRPIQPNIIHLHHFYRDRFLKIRGQMWTSYLYSRLLYSILNVPFAYRSQTAFCRWHSLFACSSFYDNFELYSCWIRKSPVISSFVLFYFLMYTFKCIICVPYVSSALVPILFLFFQLLTNFPPMLLLPCAFPSAVYVEYPLISYIYLFAPITSHVFSYSCINDYVIIYFSHIYIYSYHILLIYMYQRL